MNQNLKDYANVKRYGPVVREERFFCAVLFHLLLTDNAVLQQLLEKAGVPNHENYTCDSVRVFVEYAMARDLWNSLDDDGKANEKKKKFILDCLGNPSGLENLETEEFNKKLVAGSKISKDKIQSPARWGEEKIKVFFKDQKFIENACKLKWAFNVKPDIVIELYDDSAVCIEAKVESGQDVYTVAGYTQTQSDVQKYLMTDLLGFNLYQVFLAPKNSKANEGKEIHHITWSELLNENGGTNTTITEAVKRVVAIEGGEE